MARSYGPGKFNTMLDAAVYSASLDGGADEEAGGEGLGWAGVMYDGKEIAKYLKENRKDLDIDVTDAEIAELRRDGSAGVIIYESDAGLVDVSYYVEEDDLLRDWAMMVHDLEYEEENPKQAKKTMHPYAAEVGAWRSSPYPWHSHAIEPEIPKTKRKKRKMGKKPKRSKNPISVRSLVARAMK